MEAIEGPVVQVQAFEDKKETAVTSCLVSEILVETDGNPNSNGIPQCPADIVASSVGNVGNEISSQQTPTTTNESVKAGETVEDALNGLMAFGEPTTTNLLENTEQIIASEITLGEDQPVMSITEPCPNDETGQDNTNSDIKPIEQAMGSLKPYIEFETNILVEKYDSVPAIQVNNTQNETCAGILSFEEQNAELSEALRSSDVSESAENNNGSQEVFNKEELLDILEGNDLDSANNSQSDNSQNNSTTEAELAFRQLQKLTSGKNKVKKSKPKVITVTVARKKQRKCEISVEKPSKNIETKFVTEKPIENIVTKLVKDWEDDEAGEKDQTDILLEETTKILKDTEPVVQKLDISNAEGEPSLSTSNKTPVTHTGVGEATPELNKSIEEGPTRRLGRVIKKKVIFDPDNPDTFTKGMVVHKNKEPPVQVDKEQPPSKKGKSDAQGQDDKEQPPSKKGKSELQVHQEISPRLETKSPVKMQWKKPSSKNNKQCKRLTEVDKLLMDEGAVNMIYQLTPEAPKGRKNMRTKAEFIKQINQNTPEAKEMKFRERKKETTKEEAEAKRILGGKQRGSLSSSVKSPSACEDFETHSADDSIIYRRHSSSSYSSSCMSPRRLSELDAAAATHKDTLIEMKVCQKEEPVENGDQEMFMADASINTSNDVINIKDCISLKEKLNSKLSKVLNKRKRESIKTDKPIKQKKIVKTPSKMEKSAIPTFISLTITLNDRVAEICIGKTGIPNNNFNLLTMKELQKAFEYIDTKKDISITLLTSSEGSLCPGLYLNPILEEPNENKLNYALSIIGSLMSLLCCMEHHSKLLVCGVTGLCSGVELAFVALCDMTVATEQCIFSLSAEPYAPPMPGTSVLTSRSNITQRLINDLVLFGRQLSASEALQHGLISRTLWPHRFHDQLRDIVRDLAAQPVNGLLLKKQLLNLRKRTDDVLSTPTSEPSSPLMSCLDAEKDLIAEYWTSAEGQEALRAHLKL